MSSISPLKFISAKCSYTTPSKFAPHPAFLQPYSPQKHQVTNTTITQTCSPITRHSLLAQFFNSTDNLICSFLDEFPLRPSIDPNHVLTGNFFPVHELPPTPCDVVEGSLPTSLNGAYIRNGPNPQFIPTGPYHLFDGDGMLHSVRIHEGRATFCSRYVKTHKFLIENQMGHSCLPSPFSSFNGTWAAITRSMVVVARALAGYFHPKLTGFGMANTNLALIGGELFALCEMDLPYVVRVTPEGEIATVARHNLHSDDPPLCMTAHPKVDPDTGEAFAYQCHIFAPFLTFFKLDSRGRKLGPNVPIHSITKQSFVHDFAITERFIVFQDIQVGVNPAEIVRGRSPVVYNDRKVPRVGILPREAEDESELVWVETPGFNMMHVINAWEEECGGKLVILAPNVVSIEDGLETIEAFRSTVEKVTICVRTGTVVREKLSEKNLEFGVINPAYAGKKNRYAYAAIIRQMPKASGVVKLDLSCFPCTVASHVYGPGCYGGEPQFVHADPDNPDADEDDGYLITYMHDENTQESWFLVLDAKSDALDVVARVKLPGRVPYGFHGLFVKESDLRNLSNISIHP